MAVAVILGSVPSVKSEYSFWSRVVYNRLKFCFSGLSLVNFLGWSLN